MKNILRLLSVLTLAVTSSAAEVYVSAWAANAPGGSPPHLNGGQLRASIAGKPVTVTGVREPGDPLILLLVMDTVGDLSRVDAARRVLTDRIRSMRPEWRVALLRAQGGLSVIEDPTNNAAALADKLNSLPVSGVPGLLDSVPRAASLAHSMLTGARLRVAVLFVTDGSIRDYRGEITAAVVNPSDRGDLSRRFNDRIIQERNASILRSLGEYTAPLFFVHLEERDQTQDIAYQNGIRQFAAASGGSAYFVRNLAEVSTTVERALDMIDSHYSIELAAPAGVRGSVEVRLESEGGLRLNYRATATVVEEGG